MDILPEHTQELVDLQELNVLVSTKLDTKSINMVTETYSLINKEAKRTFVDQQKWLD